MDTQLLEAFQAVAYHGSFSRAGEQLHLTQPAISKRIAQLEELLGCRLFDRVGRNTLLTEAGKALQPRAKAILEAVDDTRNVMHNLSGQIQGALNIATSHHVGLHHLPSLLRRFTQKHPQVTPDITFIDSEKAYQAVLNGDVELAVVTLTPAEQLASGTPIESQPIWKDPLTFVCATDYPLALLSATTLTDLSRYPAILPDPDSYTTRLITRLFNANGLSLNVSMKTNYLETIKMMASVGLGWTVLPDTMLDDDNLTRLQLPGIDISRDLGVIFHRERTLTNAARSFIRLLNEET